MECPVCDSEVRGPLQTFTPKEAATHFCPPSRDRNRYSRLVDCISDLWDSGVCEIYRCPSCGFGFGHPLVGGNERFYSILHEQADYPNWRWGYDFALSFLTGKSPGSVLDIGAGTGTFLSSLDGEWNLHAVEKSKKTREKLKEKRIRTYGSVEQVNKSNFDCVTMFKTLEHVSQFRGLIKSVARLLNVGGIFIITVPDAEQMFKQERIIGCKDMPPNHINKWSPESLKKALEKGSFRNIAYEEEPKSIGNALEKIHMKIMANSQNEKSLSSKIYKIESRTLRAIIMAIFAPFVTARMVNNISFLFEGGAFGMVGERK